MRKHYFFNKPDRYNIQSKEKHPYSLSSSSIIYSTARLSSNNSSNTARNKSPSIAVIENKLVDQSTGQTQNIHKTLKDTIDILEQYSAPEPIISACHLFSFVLKNEFTWEDNGFSILQQMLENPNSFDLLKEKRITKDEMIDLTQMIYRRIQKEPLQYIIGQWDFHSITLRVRQPCLCPRPETEELVEYTILEVNKIISCLRARKETRKVRILDVGSGTGAIGIALVNFFPFDVDVLAIDISSEATKLSRENAEFVLGDTQGRYKSLLCSSADLTDELNRKGNEKYAFGFDLVVSNPPYIPRQDMATLTDDVLKFEDHRALCGGGDGMDVIRDIIHQLPEWCLNEKNNTPVCYMEVDPSHPSQIQHWLSSEQREQSNDKMSVQFAKVLLDLSGQERFVKLKIINNAK